MNYYELEPENNTFGDVSIDVTHRCNMMCKNCYIPNRDIPDMNIDRMIEAISRFPKRTMIRIVGAEPTMRKDLPELIRRVRATSHRTILLTNGLRLANDAYCKILKATRLSHVYLSLNGIDNDNWYEEIDELRCATKKVQALQNLVNNKFIIDTGTIIVKGINDDAIGRLLHLFKQTGLQNGVARIKNVGAIGRSVLDDNPQNYTMDDLIALASYQTGLSIDYIESWKNKPIYENTHVEPDNFMFPIDSNNANKSLHKGGIWFKLADWGRQNDSNIPLANNTRRGRLTENFKVAPFFEHVKLNEGGY